MRLANCCRAMGLILFVCGVSACAPQQPKVQTPPPAPVDVEPDYLEHQVRYSGESLGIIAQWYTGKQQNWTALRDANPGLKPDRIRIGQTIRIPRDLIVKEEALPQSFIKKSAGTAKKPAPKDAGAPSPQQLEGLGIGTEEAPSATPENAKAETPADLAAASAAVKSEGAPAAQNVEKPADAAPSPAQGAPAATGGEPNDAERERLLDELLQ